MRLRTITADRLPFALLDDNQLNDRATEQKYEYQRGHDRSAGAKRDVPKHVQERDFVGELGQPVEHRVKSWISPLRRSLIERGPPRKLPFQRLDDRAHF